MYNTFRRLLAPKITPLNTIEISRGSILHNLAVLEQLAWSPVFPVLKSNAYGHGLQQLSTILAKTTCPYICVDSFPEYQIVRHRAQKPVLVMGETNVENYHLYKYDATLAVSSLETLRALIAMRHPRKIHLFLNTGMHREWLQQAELATALQIMSTAKHLHLEWVMSHLACADEVDDALTQKQVYNFSSMYKQIVDAWYTPYRRHIANSAGITKVRDPFFNGARTGIALYGYSPLQSGDTHNEHYETLSPAFRVLTTVVGVQNLLPWDSISYGATYTAGSSLRSATLPFGYYEWLPRAVSNQWLVRRNEQLLPVRGRVCMNLCCIDTLWQPVQKGDAIEIISPDKDAPHTIEALARMCGTLSYEVLVKFSEKTRRTIVA
jgi:alanine racemase